MVKIIKQVYEWLKVVVSIIIGIEMNHLGCFKQGNIISIDKGRCLFCFVRLPTLDFPYHRVNMGIFGTIGKPSPRSCKHQRLHGILSNEHEDIKI